MSGSGTTRQSRPLTTKLIESLKPEVEPYRVPDQRCRGLALRVATSGRKTWDLAYRVKGTGKVRRCSLGAFDDVGLEAARMRADEITRAARGGHDLLAEELQAKRESAARVTVGQLIDAYVARPEAQTQRTAKEIASRLRRALAPISDRHAADLRRRDIRELLDPVAERGARREAEKRRLIVGSLFRWAVSRDDIETDPTAGLPSYGAAERRDRVLDDAEIRTMWHWLSASTMPGSVVAILRLQLALGARCGEIAGMHAEEIDPRDWLWTLPAARSKNGRPRTTPLVGMAREMIRTRLELVGERHLFVTGADRPLASANVGHAIKVRRGKIPIAHFTTHDLRRTVATNLVVMGASFEQAALCIGHDPGTRQTKTLVRHYVRDDFLRLKTEIFMAWDARLRTVVAGESESAETLNGGSLVLSAPDACP